MTLEDFISKFNSGEIHLALKTQGLPNVGTKDDKINKLAKLTISKSDIKFLLSILDEFRLREISLEFAVAGAGTMNQGRLMDRIAQIMLGEYEPLDQQVANIEYFQPLAILAAAASIVMIIFIPTALFFSTPGPFIAALVISIPISFYLYILVKSRLRNRKTNLD